MFTIFSKIDFNFLGPALCAGTLVLLVMSLVLSLAVAIGGFSRGWGIVFAVLGMVLKLFFWRTPGRFGPALYLVMGWLSLALIWSLWPIVPVPVVVLIAAGGLLYTAGVPFYASETMKYAIAIWHGFVVVASGCFFAAIAMATAALG